MNYQSFDLHICSFDISPQFLAINIARILLDHFYHYKKIFYFPTRPLPKAAYYPLRNYYFKTTNLKKGATTEAILEVTFAYF